MPVLLAADGMALGSWRRRSDLDPHTFSIPRRRGRRPRPHGDRGVDLAVEGVEAHFAIAQVDDRPDVAFLDLLATTVCFTASTSCARLKGISIINIRAEAKQPVYVISQAENAGAFGFL